MVDKIITKFVVQVFREPNLYLTMVSTKCHIYVKLHVDNNISQQKCQLVLVSGNPFK